MQKTYSSRSNAKRAALVAYPEGNFVIVPEGEGFTFAADPLLADAPAVELPAWPFPKAAEINVPFAWPAKATKVRAASTRVLREERNGVKKPLKGVCADLWAAFDEANAEGNLSIAEVRAYASHNGLNTNNATLEFYAWRKFNAPVAA